jgi:phage tail-like protein
MRGVVDSLASPLPLAADLPAVYQEEDPFAVRLAGAFDTELAPIISTLDNLSAYFDPRLAPEDFLGWLASWIALELDETWDVARRRAAMLAAVDIMRRRGTGGRARRRAETHTDGEVEVIENGGSAYRSTRLGHGRVAGTRAGRPGANGGPVAGRCRPPGPDRQVGEAARAASSRSSGGTPKKARAKPMPRRRTARQAIHGRRPAHGRRPGRIVGPASRHR